MCALRLHEQRFSTTAKGKLFRGLLLGARDGKAYERDALWSAFDGRTVGRRAAVHVRQPSARESAFACAVALGGRVTKDGREMFLANKVDVSLGKDLKVRGRMVEPSPFVRRPGGDWITDAIRE